MSLNNTAALKNPTLYDFRVGALMATDGAWNRKYRVVKVDEVAIPAEGVTFGWRGMVRATAAEISAVLEVTVENLGSYFADGTVKPARRRVLNTFKVYGLVNGKVLNHSRQVLVREMDPGDRLDSHLNKVNNARQQRLESEIRWIERKRSESLDRALRDYKYAIQLARQNRIDTQKAAQAEFDRAWVSIKRRYRIK